MLRLDHRRDLPRWTQAGNVDVSARKAAHRSGIVYAFSAQAPYPDAPPPERISCPGLPWRGWLQGGRANALAQLHRHRDTRAEQAAARLLRLSQEAAAIWAFEAWDACMDCAAPTTALGEYFMVHTAVWEQAVAPHQRAGMLCVACLELRLGRWLTPADFTSAPINRAESGHSARLLQRLGRPGSRPPDAEAPPPC